jgi:hypothetical protein
MCDNVSTTKVKHVIASVASKEFGWKNFDEKLGFQKPLPLRSMVIAKML